MSTSVEFAPADQQSLEHIAQNMRQADIEEILASSYMDPLTSLMWSKAISDYCSIMKINGTPIAVFGLVRDNALCGDGSPWLLGTNEIDRHPKSYLKASKQIVAEMLKVCPKLSNYVHAKNEASVRYLRKLQDRDWETR